MTPDQNQSARKRLCDNNQYVMLLFTRPLLSNMTEYLMYELRENMTEVEHVMTKKTVNKGLADMMTGWELMSMMMTTTQ